VRLWYHLLRRLSIDPSVCHNAPVSLTDPLADGGPAEGPGPPSGVRRERHIERAQAARRDRIRAAAQALASEGGYAAVTMHDVAERAGVGRATVYRYYSSKDHLIADVHLTQSAQLIEELRAVPPTGKTPADRLSEVGSRVIEVAAGDLKLTEAGVWLALSDDPAIASAQEWRARMMHPYLDAALGDDTTVDRETVAEVMQAVLFQALAGLARGRYDAEEAKAVLSRAAHALLDR
jgi:TetR/AcrR family transcriptional regulator, cholesterol catabolism regulator